MSLHPAVALAATGVLLVALRGRGRRAVMLAGTLASAALAANLAPGQTQFLHLGAWDLVPLFVDRLSWLFGLIFTVITVIGSLYAAHLGRCREHVAVLGTATGSLVVVFAGDWVTLFVGWEMIAVSSAFLIWLGRGRDARGAGFRYLMVHASGGALLLAGILRSVGQGAGTQVSPLDRAEDPIAFWLMLGGVAVNAAIPPLHAWLTDAYPRASVTASVFLSAFATKTAVYVLIRVFPGADVLVGLGVTMALYGVVYAVLENDIRRLLAYHVVSQVGYMVAGVGLGTALSLDGAAAHAFCHILYKGLLFMGVGAVIHATGRNRLTELGGLAPRMRAVLLLYCVGAVSISGFPLFNGFVSKSMIISAAAGSGRDGVVLLLLVASVGTFLHTGLKLPYFVFFGERCDAEVKAVPRNMLAAMAIAAALCFVIGVQPDLLYAWLPLGAEYQPYTTGHLLESLQLLAGTGLAFWWLRGRLGGSRTISLDTDWLYRGPGGRLGAVLTRLAARGGAAALGASSSLAAMVEKRLRDPLAWLRETPQAGHYNPDRDRLPVGATVFWIVAYFAIVAFFARG